MSLYIVATPIGNLADITLRALEILRTVDLVLAEDTRRTRILLKSYSINKRLVSFNDFNKKGRTRFAIEELRKGRSIALVSDSGTPGISDPGFYLIREAIRYDIRVIPIPGPTALITALLGSGFSTDSFAFYGFLPKKDKKKKDFFNKIINSNMTTIIYESPHRLVKTLQIISEMLPERRVCVARELTKKFEEFIRGRAIDVYKEIRGKDIRGEVTIVIDKA